jgi:uncharacterized repeat protein (TIGR03803 family)
MPAGKQTKAAALFLFDNSDGSVPLASVIRDTSGNLYGSTAFGGSSANTCMGRGCGVVYKLTKGSSGWTQSFLYKFTGGADGGNPWSVTLFRDSAGNLYGTAIDSGNQYSGCGNPDGRWGSGCGTVYKIDPSGNFSVIYAFKGPPDADSPLAGVIADPNGNLYGTTNYGGQYGYGTVYEIDTKGQEAILHSFSGGADGWRPQTALVRDRQGNLYGTTYGNSGYSGGCYGYSCGVIFKLHKGRKTWNFRTLYTFTGGADAAQPNTPILDAAGNMYGTTVDGPSGTLTGTIWELSHSGTFATLYRFTGGADGGQPLRGQALLRDSKGNLYGTAATGGINYFGTAWELNTRHHLKVLYSFGQARLYGVGTTPFSGLVTDSTGDLYGTASHGGAYGTYGGFGTVFELIHAIH